MQLSVLIPKTGSIVLSIPTYSPDETYQYFNKNLKSTFSQADYG